MSCLPISRVAPTSYPISHLLSDLAQTLPSCLCKSDSEAFKTVYLYDAHGQPVNSTDGHSSFTKDVVTKQLYWNDVYVRAKCAALPFGIPLLTAGVIVWHAIALVYNIVVVVARILQNGYHFVCREKMHETGITQLPCIIYERVKGILAAPFYGVAMEVAALFGAVFKPNHGRKLVAMIEHSWRNGASYEEEEVFYLGWCMQVRGKVIDKEDGAFLESSVSLEKDPEPTSVKRVHIEWVRLHRSAESSSSTQANPLTSS